MPITSTDIKLRLSGGAANSNPNASLGGAKSTTEMGTALHNLFDIVSDGETTAGDTEYRCIYIHNSHATLTMQSTRVWISSNTPSTDTQAEIGLGTAAINGTEQTVADESTAPTGVTFGLAENEGAALTIGDIPPGQHKAVWVKRVVAEGAAAYNDDQATISVKCATAA